MRCHAYHRNPKVLSLAYCKGNDTKHVLVECQAMCRVCKEKGHMKDLVSSPCPKVLNFEIQDVVNSEKKDDKSSASPKMMDDLGKATSLHVELEKATKELKRLQVLRNLEVERKRLADLMARRSAISSFLIAKSQIYAYLRYTNSSFHALCRLCANKVFSYRHL